MSIAYLCGHLHTLGGLVPQMYTMQDEGFAELELADWKDRRMLVESRSMASNLYELADHIRKLTKVPRLDRNENEQYLFYTL